MEPKIQNPMTRKIEADSPIYKAVLNASERGILAIKRTCLKLQKLSEYHIRTKDLSGIPQRKPASTATRRSPLRVTYVLGSESGSACKPEYFAETNLTAETNTATNKSESITKISFKFCSDNISTQNFLKKNHTACQNEKDKDILKNGKSSKNAFYVKHVLDKKSFSCKKFLNSFQNMKTIFNKKFSKSTRKRFSKVPRKTFSQGSLKSFQKDLRRNFTQSILLRFQKTKRLLFYFCRSALTDLLEISGRS